MTDAEAPDVREITRGLEFPEGPVALSGGDVLVVEVRGGRLTRVAPDGTKSVVADVGGGPNGAAIGPDGAAYVVNNGGFPWMERGGMHIPMDEHGTNMPPGFTGGWVDRVELESGKVLRLYEECEGERFLGPNDIVFDADGGFWFTDFGKMRHRSIDRGCVYYAAADGSSVVRAAEGLLGPNGIGLSPSGDRVYVAESFTGRLISWEVTAPGVLDAKTIVVATPGHFDSLAVEADGSVLVAAIGDGVCVVRPDGSVSHVAIPDAMTTNVCFSGVGLDTLYVTLSGGGRLVALEWPRPGLPLAFSA